MNRHAILAVILLVGLFTFNWFNNSDQQTMPTVIFTDIDQRQHTLEQYKGKPILIIFWATDCPGCIAETPELIALHEEYSSQGLTMIAVAMAHDSLYHIKAMRHDRQLPYTITWDENASIAQAFNNVRVTPTHFLINPKGEIVMRKIGALSIARLHNILQDMGLDKS